MDSKTSWFATKVELPVQELVDWKLNADSKEICGGTRCGALKPLYEEVYKYKVNDVPNYSKCRFMLQIELMNCFCKPDKYYSFLQRKINFVGFVINQTKEEEIGISYDDSVDE